MIEKVISSIGNEENVFRHSDMLANVSRKLKATLFLFFFFPSPVQRLVGRGKRFVTPITQALLLSISTDAKLTIAYTRDAILGSQLFPNYSTRKIWSNATMDGGQAEWQCTIGVRKTVYSSKSTPT
jgi:hypothetical protein